MVMENKNVSVRSRRCRRRQPSSPDWASLPSVPLDEILNRLIQGVDYLRFSVVCKPWLSAALYQNDRRLRSDQKLLPMLLMPPLRPTPGETEKQSLPSRRLYSVTHNKLLKWNELKIMPTPAPSRGRFCGSSYGWLGLDNDDLTITLFNPFSGNSIQLPPLHPRPIVHPLSPGEKQVRKFVCSGDPSFLKLNGNDDFMVGTIFGSNANFAYYVKPGRGSHHKGGWTHIAGRGFKDVVYHCGKFYVIDFYPRVISVDVSISSGEEQPPQVQVLVYPITRHLKQTYIFVSSGGEDLLLAERVRNEGYLTEGFKVFKLSLNTDHSKYADKIEIDNLGNDALFLGDNHALCVSASHGCRPNCIYITDFGEANIYSLEDRSFMSLKRIKTKLMRVHYPPPIWILPTML